MNAVLSLAVALTISGGAANYHVTPPDAAHARCSVGTLRENPEGYFWPLADIQRFVARAEVIVRAKATERVRRHPPNTQYAIYPQSEFLIVFEILEVLRGDSTVTRLTVPGDTLATDDFNHSSSVPYRAVRPNGQGGSCYARHYKLGAEFLLLLARDGRDEFTPYWAALAPMNEQVRGKDDPWVVWVRSQLRGQLK